MFCFESVPPYCFNYKPKAADPKPKKIADSMDFQIKYKTEICRYWLEHGFCNYGENVKICYFMIIIRI